MTEDPTLLLEEIRRLMEIKGENRFKVLAYEKAAQNLAESGLEREGLLERAKAGSLTQIPGIGKGIAQVLTEFLLEGKSTELENLKDSIPKGLIELTEIPGIGPKKASLLIQELSVHSVAELEYACKENRLLKLKGFGQKIQDQILDGISFRNGNLRLRKYSDIEETTQALLKELREICSQNHSEQVEETGSLRRRTEVLNQLDFLVEEPPTGKTSLAELKTQINTFLSRFVLRFGLVLPIDIHYSKPENFVSEWIRTTGTPEHLRALSKVSGISESTLNAPGGVRTPFQTEEEFFKKIGLPWIPPETRETGEEVALAKRGDLSQLLPWDGIQGVFHNHTVRSDGTATLEEMVQTAEDLGYRYIGISDHSQSAHYAQGLKPEDILEQEKEIRIVQKRHPGIRIFWGIESDILADGSLDYDESILKRFDFVIASIHSRFKMDEKQMTQRILTAVRNPYTRFLGHPTGRILLGRKGYDLDLDEIIRVAAERQVAVELNSNPSRLDIDWRWGPSFRKYGTFTSINPDAHETSGLRDTRFGVMMARKAMIPRSQIINSSSVDEMEKWLSLKN